MYFCAFIAHWSNCQCRGRERQKSGCPSMNVIRALSLLVSVILLVMINKEPHLAPIIMRLL